MRCSKCAHVFDAHPGQVACPSCGAQIDPSPASAQPTGPSPWETPAAPPSNDPFFSGEDGIPWEVRPSLTSLIETVREALLRPTALFDRAEPERSLGLALVFALILGVLGNVAGLVVQHLMMGQMIAFLGQLVPDAEPFVEQFAAAKSASEFLVSLVIVPFAVLIYLFVSAGIVHLTLMMLGGQRGSFEATFRAMAYANAPAPLQFVPFIGGFVVAVWTVFIGVVATRSLHQVSTGKAVIAVLTPRFLAVLCCCCVVILGVVLAGSAGALLPTPSNP